MELILVFVSVDIIASKFLRAFVASHPASQAEENSMLDHIFRKIVISSDPWLSFFLTVLFVGGSLIIIRENPFAPALLWMYFIIGVFTTILNLGATHTCYFGRKNFITRKLLR